jgi:hypothetical protein
MAEKTKPRRRKTEPDRINLDDWGNAGALDGLLSFLNIAPEQAPVNQGSSKVLHLLEDRTGLKESPRVLETAPITDSAEASPPPVSHSDPDSPDQISTHDPGDEGLPVIDAVSEAHPPSQKNTPETNPVPQPLTDTPSDLTRVPDIEEDHELSETGGPSVLEGVIWRHPKQATGFGNKKLYRCVCAQDGHSHSEEALYQILWQAGRPETDQTRLTIMGYGEMSKRVRLSFNNTKYACHRLIAKLAIEEVAREISDQRQGKTYRVFSHEAILERRHANGLDWVIRNKGVEFVTPKPLSISDTPPFIGTVPVQANATITGRVRFSIKDGGLIRDTPSAEHTALFSLLTQYGEPTLESAELLWARCRKVVPDCTLGEVAYFVQDKGALVLEDSAGRIPDPIGFLLTTVPKSLASEAFTKYRESERTRLQAEIARQRRREAEIEQWRREQEAILRDPNAAEEEKQLARRVLGVIESR